MRLPKFNYIRPGSLEEADRILSEQGTKARLSAGGTELYPRMKYGLDCPEVVVGLKALPVKTPFLAGEGTLVLDALMSLTSVRSSLLIQEKAPVLAESAGFVASHEIRNMGTLGGNLCQETRCLYFNQKHDFQFVAPCFKRGGNLCYFIPKGKKCWAVFMSDVAPALMSMDAKVKIIGQGESRIIALDELYTGEPKEPISLGPREILTEIQIPASHHPRGSASAKFTLRGAVEFAVLNVAVVLETKDNGKTCSKARISVGAVSASPLRAVEAESSLAGESLSKRLFPETAQKVVDELRIIPHHGFSSLYLTQCLRVQTERVLSTALERIKAK
jgi:CO/xanthine dehydrogenase FAD-binding subunit